MTVPVIVVGGGPAGSAAAAALAGAGRAVTVIERAPEASDKVCGDFLSAEAAEMLLAGGVDVGSLGPAAITRLRFINGRRAADTALPFTGFGLTRRALDEALLRHAAARGATVLRGHAVRALRRDGCALIAEAGALGELRSHAVVLASGKHDLRGLARAQKSSGGLIGFKSYFHLAPAQTEALRGYVEIILFDGGYAGLQLVEGGRANLCLLVSGPAFQRAGGTWEPFLARLCEQAPHLSARLDGAQATAARPVSIARIPYGFIHRAVPADPPGLFRIGDQACVIPSMTGDGVSIALHSGRAAARAVLGGQDAAGHHRSLARAVSGQIRLAMAAHTASTFADLQPWVVAACRAAPGLMRLIASRTRVRSPSLVAL